MQVCTQVWKIPCEATCGSRIQSKLEQVVHLTFSDQNELQLEKLDGNNNRKTLLLEKLQMLNGF